MLARIFETDAQALRLEWGPDQIGAWDSLGHLNLIVATEERFGVSFSTDEIASIESIGDLVARLREHGVAVDWPEAR